MEKFKNFHTAKYEFTITVKENLSLPHYKGSTFRGAFGSVFRKLCCVNKKMNSCQECSLRVKCTYAYIFETAPSLESNKLKNLDEIPRPFVIEPPVDEKLEYIPGEKLIFSLILIGQAIEYLPYFIFTFKEMGSVGIGKNRGKYQLEKVLSNREMIYSSEDDIIRNIKAVSPVDFFSEGGNVMTLNFLTPTRLKFKGDLLVNPDFHHIVRALLHRLSALSYFHCGYDLDVNYKSLIADSEKIMTKKRKMKWVDWERYSSRQNTKMKMGGFVGTATYEGNFNEFLPLLKLGESVHIGKNCTFGLGKYEIMKENESGR